MTSVEDDRELPLTGLEVLDLGALLPGPFCTAMLADLGADVTRIEAPSGDYMRGIPGDSFAQVNRNKTGLVLDLREPGGRDECRRMARSAAVVVEGFRPGVAARLGVGYGDLSTGRDDLIYCSISGFGQEGPDRLAPGHDLTYLAASGVLSLPGHWGEEPQRPGVPVSDLMAGSFAAIAILASLEQRRRSGKGAHLDIAIADVALAMAAVRGTHDRGEDSADRAQNHLVPTNDLFRTADAVTLAVAAVEEPFWRSLRTVLARFDARVEDERYDTAEGRRHHGDALKEILVRVFASRTAEEWMTDFAGLDVPVHRVATVAEAISAAQDAGRGVVCERDGIRYVPFPVKRDRVPMSSIRMGVPGPPANSPRQPQEAL
jgi:crotonobetainyl-CoA:carnitine CoA-transferase CaiB-like acyl-CoA transferase